VSRGELHAWIHEHLKLSQRLESALFAAVDAVFTRHDQMWEASKEEAIQALCSSFAEKMARVQVELSAKDATVSSISTYFEQLVADLTDKSYRDPKTKLMNLTRFTEQLESYLALERRGRWCAVGLADIRRFKWYNDSLGHVVGDRLIERVAQLLREQARNHDLVAKERPGSSSEEVHARFGGDEFCFLIPRLQERSQAYAIGERFRQAVTQYDWSVEDDRLAAQPVVVDVGMVCLRLGKVAERSAIAGRLPAELIQRADKRMYEAKSGNSNRISCEHVEIKDGELVALTDLNESAAES
jgi:diguanylate cyclase (GGDEF)-like protein